MFAIIVLIMGMPCCANVVKKTTRWLPDDDDDDDQIGKKVTSKKLFINMLSYVLRQIQRMWFSC